MISTTKVRTSTHIVHPQQQEADRAHLLEDQARRWADFVREHARMRPATIERKAADSLAFCHQNRTRSFAVPSKLGGTREHQQALLTLHEMNPMRGHLLGVTDDGERLVVDFVGMRLGYVQDKHVPWLRPLMALGASVHLLTVTGTDSPEKYLGLNVAFAFVTQAIERLRVSGDGAASEPPVLDEDVLLWRDPDGTARTNVAHFPRHSPSGIEWGYGGSGPADLARSILLRHAGKRRADLLYQKFKHEVITQVPREGGQITAAFVRSWLSRQDEA